MCRPIEGISTKHKQLLYTVIINTTWFENAHIKLKQ